MYWVLLLRLLVVSGLVAVTGPVLAQRVAFPSATASPSPYQAFPTTPTPTYAPAAPPSLPSFDPYGNPLLGTPPSDVPYATTAPLQAPGPYTSPGALTNGVESPVGWQQGAYQYQNPDGSTVQLQRLLQQLSYEQTWLGGDGSFDQLGINRTELSATFAFPIFYNADTPLLVTPGFAFNWLHGPTGVAPPHGGLPPRIYDAYLDTAWRPKLTDVLSADLGFRTGVWSDFEEVNHDSVRYLGRGLGVLALSPRFDVLVGVWYLDRNRIKMLPAGGIHWHPNTEWDAYIVFPNPKISKRFTNIGSSQWWWYFAGEYGGGRWTVKRDDGAGDDIDINGIRIFFGLEWETQTQARGHVEIGYVWDREIVYDKIGSPPKSTLDDTVMIRGGIDF